MFIETADTIQFEDKQIIARTAWGEARSLGVVGMTATLCTLQNRLTSGVTWWGQTLRQICLEPCQYSCWNRNDPNRPKLIALDEMEENYQAILPIVDQLISGKLADTTNGATHYFNHLMPAAAWPSWASTHDVVFEIEPHWFYRVTD